MNECAIEINDMRDKKDVRLILNKKKHSTYMYFTYIFLETETSFAVTFSNTFE